MHKSRNLLVARPVKPTLALRAEAERDGRRVRSSPMPLLVWPLLLVPVFVRNQVWPSPACPRVRAQHRLKANRVVCPNQSAASAGTLAAKPRPGTLFYGGEG